MDFYKSLNNFHSVQISFEKHCSFYFGQPLSENTSSFHCVWVVDCHQVLQRYQSPSMEDLAKVQELVICLFGYLPTFPVVEK